MSTWNSRGLRGSTLEELVNRTNEQYREKGLALIQKVPTPITPIKIDKEHRHITLAYFEQKSTVDYIGAVQGIPVCFDAKECKTDTFLWQMYISIRYSSWLTLNGRRALLSFCCISQPGISFTICVFPSSADMWTGRTEGG